MRVRPGDLADVQRNPGIAGQGAEEFLEQLGVHLADLGRVEAHLPAGIGAAGNVDARFHQRLVHRQRGEAKPRDAALVAQRLLDRLTKHDADILGGVMKIDMQITHRLDRHVDQAVAAKRREHVVKKPDAGADRTSAGAIEIQRDGDVGLGGLAGDCCGACHGGRGVAENGGRGQMGRARGGGRPTAGCVTDIRREE